MHSALFSPDFETAFPAADLACPAKPSMKTAKTA
jgi:hypothetical protein